MKTKSENIIRKERIISHIDEKDFSNMRLKLCQLYVNLFITSAVFFIPMTALCTIFFCGFAVKGLTVGTMVHFFLLLSFMMVIGVFLYLPYKRQVLKSSHKQIELRPKSICVIYQRENFRISLDELSWRTTQSYNPLFSEELYCGIRKRGILFS